MLCIPAPVKQYSPEVSSVEILSLTIILLKLDHIVWLGLVRKMMIIIVVVILMVFLILTGMVWGERIFGLGLISRFRFCQGPRG